MFKINPAIQNYSNDYKNFSLQQSSTVPDEENAEKLNDDLGKLSQIGKSQINFRAGEFRLNKYDAMFVGALGTAFGLTAASLDKVKDTIGEFLKSNNLSSMGDIGGEENIDMQSQLTGKISDAINLDEKYYESLVGKVIHRCDSTFDYNPNDDYIERMSLRLENTIKDGITLLKQNDEKFINAVILTLDLNSEQQACFRDIIKNLNLVSLKSLSNQYNSDKIDIFFDEITENLNLTNVQQALLTAEFSRRISANETNYTPKINPIDRNIGQSIENCAAVGEVCKKYKLNLQEIDEIIIAMKQDAYENGMSSIFEIFNEPSKMKQLEKTLNSKKYANIKDDLLIDLYSASTKSGKISHRTQEKEDSSQYIKQCAITCLLDDKLNFSKNTLSVIKKYFKSNDLNLHNQSNFWKTVYELSDLLGIESKTVEEAIRQVNDFSEEELKPYGFLYCQMLMDKK